MSVVGQLRTFNGKHNITAFAVRAVEDHNEITHHHLDCILTHLQNTRGPVNKAISAVPMGASFGSLVMGSNLKPVWHQDHDERRQRRIQLGPENGDECVR